MNPTRTTYTCGELLDDDYFILSVLHPTPESELFWDSLLADGLVDADAYESARHFILLMQDSPRSMSEKEKALLLASIEVVNKRRLKRSLRRKQFFLYGTVAALLLVLVALGYTWLAGTGELSPADFHSIMARIPEAGTAANDIQLILSEDTTITLEEKKADIVVRKGGRIVLNDTRQVDQQATTGKDGEQKLNQLIVPFGRHSLLTLSDGTRMHVNAGTRVVFPNEFTGKTRDIFVDGEVFLEVFRDEEKPFRVHTSQMEVNVLGTSFNVNAYERDSKSAVVLVSGSVRVQADGQKETHLSPNQKFDLADGVASVSVVDAVEFTSWKDGYFIYRGEKLDQVMKQLSRYYNVSIHYEAGLSAINCYGKLDLKDDIGLLIADLSDLFRLQVDKVEGGYTITAME